MNNVKTLKIELAVFFEVFSDLSNALRVSGSDPKVGDGVGLPTG